MKLQEPKARRIPSAFTILEVLNAVTIVGILVGVGLVALQGQTRRIEALELKNQISALNAAVQSYELSGGVRSLYAE